MNEFLNIVYTQNQPVELGNGLVAPDRRMTSIIQNENKEVRDTMK